MGERLRGEAILSGAWTLVDQGGGSPGRCPDGTAPNMGQPLRTGPCWGLCPLRLSWFLSTALANRHTLGGFKQQKLTLTVLEARSPRSVSRGWNRAHAHWLLTSSRSSRHVLAPRNGGRIRPFPLPASGGRQRVPGRPPPPTSTCIFTRAPLHVPDLPSFSHRQQRPHRQGPP